eukprot:TRINITY_DN6112_c0_g1_i1.p1 TRINITY_DN6112_c0_g1~~TRINITY_DN6112_c0_g1_i1.p1  ORF type:complete len:472 (+),score=133.85 TRINITY_DN6112_c0_g1_i1:78-1493(+)
MESTVDVGAECRQYQHVLAVATSQEQRLVTHAALRRRPGYDLTDPWLVSDGAGGSSASTKLVPGMPCTLLGSGEVVAYLETVGSASSGQCRTRSWRGRESVVPRAKLLPLPTRSPVQGEWAFAVDLPPGEAHLVGRRGLLGLHAPMPGKGGAHGFWVMFEPTEEGLPPLVALIDEKRLVTLPMPLAGAPRTPWESRAARLTAPDGAGVRLRLADAPADTAPLPALEDEGAQEQRLALRLQDEDGAASEDGSVDLSESEDEEPELAEGSLVRVPGTTAAHREAQRYGRVADIEGGAAGAATGSARLLARATVRLFDGTTESFLAAELTLASVADLEVSAVCDHCGHAEPEPELLLCENFAQRCLGAMHISCLDPPLSAVPEGDWYCAQCLMPEKGASASKPARGAGASKAAITAAAKSKPKAGAEAKAKAKAAAKSSGASAGGSGGVAAKAKAKAKGKAKDAASSASKRRKL